MVGSGRKPQHVAVDREDGLGRDEGDGPGGESHPVRGGAQHHGGAEVEPVGRQLVPVGRRGLHQQKREVVIVRKPGEEPSDSFEPAGRGPDADDGHVG